MVFVAVLGHCALLFWRLPSSFLPAEDQGNIMVVVQLPPGATMQRTTDVMTRMTRILRSNPAIDGVMEVGGFSFVGSGENVGMGFVRLKPWGERDQSAEQVIQWANKHLHQIRDASIFATNLPVIRGLGRFGGFDFQLEDASGAGHKALSDAAATLVTAAGKEPALSNVRINGLEDAPQLQVDVSRLEARAMGLSVSDVYQTIQLMLAPVYANDFNYQGRVQRVQLQADAPYRMGKESLDHMYVHSSKGAMVPISSVVDTHWDVAAPTLDRYNGLASIGITGNAAPGYSSGQAMDTMQRLVRDELPQGIGYEWSGPVAAGDSVRRPGPDRLRPVAAGGVPVPGGTVRELVGAAVGADGRASGRARHAVLHLGTRTQRRHLFQGGPDRHHRSGRKERHSDHRVRTRGTATGQRRHRGGHGSMPPALPTRC